MSVVRTTCAYCGVGCGIRAEVTGRAWQTLVYSDVFMGLAKPGFLANTCSMCLAMTGKSFGCPVSERSAALVPTTMCAAL